MEVYKNKKEKVLQSQSFTMFKSGSEESETIEQNQVNDLKLASILTAIVLESYSL